MKNGTKTQNVNSKSANLPTTSKDVKATATAEPSKPAETPTQERKEELKQKIESFAPIANDVKGIVEALRPISAEERISRVKNFEILSSRFAFLKGKSDDLKRFELENAGTTAKLILKNQSGFEFEVSNSTVIQKALTVIAEELKIMLNDTENEVVTFEI